MSGKKLTRSSTDKMLAGVCSGLAEYFNIDASIVRIVFVLLVIFGQAGLLIYLVLWLLLPLDEGGPRGYDDIVAAFRR